MNKMLYVRTGCRHLLLLVLCLMATTGAMADVTVKASAPATVSVGERFQLSFVVNDMTRDITLPDIDGFDILMGPSTSSSSSHTIVNGKVESSRQTIFTYVLKARAKGSYTLPSASVVVSGQTYSSNKPTIHVVEGAASSASSQSAGASQSSSSSAAVSKSQTGDDLLIVQSLTSSTVYEGEATQLVTKVYTKVDLNSISDRKEPKLADFVVSDMSPQSITFSRDVLNGVEYQVAEITRKVLIPQKSGKITIEPTEMEFVVRKRVRRSGSRSFFDSFFDDVQMTRQKVSTKAVTLTVKPLPANRPTGYSGGVGQFKFDVQVSPTDVDVDNSVTVKVVVEGAGNLKLLTMPRPQFHQDFDTFDPNQKSDLTPTADGYKGRRTDEYLIIPRRDGQFDIPQLSFSYFDTKKGQYTTITKGPFTLNVSKGDGTGTTHQGTGATFSGVGPEQVTYTGSDLRYLHRSQGLSRRHDFFLFSPLFWLLTLLPIACLVTLFFVYRKRVFENANAGLVKSRRANKVAQRRLKLVKKYIAEDKREEFFDEVMRALWGYLSDRLTMPVSELTKDNVREKMAEHGVTTEAADEFIALLDECEFARYAPVGVSSTLTDLYEKAAEVIGMIENNTKK